MCLCRSLCPRKETEVRRYYTVRPRTAGAEGNLVLLAFEPARRLFLVSPVAPLLWGLSPSFLSRKGKTSSPSAHAHAMEAFPAASHAHARLLPIEQRGGGTEPLCALAFCPFPKGKSFHTTPHLRLYLFPLQSSFDVFRE